MSRLKIKKEYVLLAVIVLIGAFLRFDGLSRPLPVQFHPDSYITVDNALRFIDFDFNYDRPFAWPAASIIHMYGIILYLFNIFVPVTKLIAVRTIQYGNAIFGTLSILLVYAAAKKMYSVRAGLVASLLFSVMMFHIQFSRNETADSLAIFLMIASIYYIVGIYKEKEKKESHSDVSYMGYTNEKGSFKLSKDIVIIGAILGAGFATKYTNMIMALPLLVAMFYKYDLFRKIFRDKNVDKVSLTGFARSCVVIAVSAVIVFSLIAPNLAFHPVQLATGILGEQKNHEGRHGLTATNGMSILDKEFRVFNELDWGFGIPLMIFSILSILYLLYKHKKEDVILASLVIIYFIFLARYPLFLTRYTVPMFPFFAIVIAASFDDLISRSKEVWQKYALYLIILLIFAYSFWYSMAYVNVFAGEDVRVTAGKWVSENMPQGSSIGIGPRTNPWMMPIADYSKYKSSETPDYIILSKAAYYNTIRYMNNPDMYTSLDWGGTLPSQEEVAFYDIIYNEKGSYKLLKSFKKIPSFLGFSVNDEDAPYTVWAITHPEIRIYKRQPSGANETG